MCYSRMFNISCRIMKLHWVKPYALFIFLSCGDVSHRIFCGFRAEVHIYFFDEWTALSQRWEQGTAFAPGMIDILVPQVRRKKGALTRVAEGILVVPQGFSLEVKNVNVVVN